MNGFEYGPIERFSIEQAPIGDLQRIVTYMGFDEMVTRPKVPDEYVRVIRSVCEDYAKKITAITYAESSC